MAGFRLQSAFAQEDERLRVAAQQSLPLMPAPTTAAMQHEAKAPLEHWWHDLGTAETLLEERHPDVRRALDMVQEIRREMERWVR